MGFQQAPPKLGFSTVLPTLVAPGEGVLYVTWPLWSWPKNLRRIPALVS
jgi:hypothetical protein